MVSRWTRTLFLASAVLLAAMLAGLPPAALAQCDNRAFPIGVGQQVQGSLGGTQLIFYRFEIASAGSYMIQTTGEQDTFGELRDAACNTIVSDDDSGLDLNFQIVQQLNPGTYYITVRGYSESSIGPFVLHLNMGQAGDCRNAQDVALGGSVDGVLNGTSFIYYRFTTPGGLVRAYTTGNSDTVGQALDSDCNLIEENDDDGEGTNFLLEGDAEAGTYYIAVRGYSDSDRSPFTLHIESGEVGEGDCSNATPVATGPATQQYMSGGARQVFSFTVSVVDTYQITTTGDLDTLGALYDSNCRLIAEDDDGGSNFNFLIQYDLTPGSYYVAVRGYDQDQNGPYNLMIYRLVH